MVLLGGKSANVKTSNGFITVYSSCGEKKPYKYFLFILILTMKGSYLTYLPERLN